MNKIKIKKIFLYLIILYYYVIYRFLKFYVFISDILRIEEKCVLILICFWLKVRFINSFFCLYDISVGCNYDIFNFFVTFIVLNRIE